MAPIITSSPRRPIAAAAALLLFLVAAAAAAERKVGGRTDIKDVLSNEEVQELGRFSVEYYNRRLRRGAAAPKLAFSRVVAAQQQVVSGIKYYLRVAAWEGRAAAGPHRTFYAVVLVKPWLRSKDLISFHPTTTS